MKVLVVGGSLHYASWINKPIEFIEDKIENVKLVDLVIFIGGADFSPSYYGFSKNDKTHSDVETDKREVQFYNEAKHYAKSMIGICKGAQMITAMQPSGLLIQHTTGHARSMPHEIEWNDGERMLASSTHHQMMYPFNIKNYELLAWSSSPLSERYEFDNNTALNDLPKKREPEVVYYPETYCIAIQPHPEQMDKNCRVVIKLNELLEEKFGL